MHSCTVIDLMDEPATACVAAPTNQNVPFIFKGRCIDQSTPFTFFWSQLSGPGLFIVSHQPIGLGLVSATYQSQCRLYLQHPPHFASSQLHHLDNQSNVSIRTIEMPQRRKSPWQRLKGWTYMTGKNLLFIYLLFAFSFSSTVNDISIGTVS